MKAFPRLSRAIIALAALPLAAQAMTLAPAPGVRDTTPVSGRGNINSINSSKGVITIDGMDFRFSFSRTRITGGDRRALTPGRRVDYTAIPEGKTQRISEITILSESKISTNGK